MLVTVIQLNGFTRAEIARIAHNIITAAGTGTLERKPASFQVNDASGLVSWTDDGGVARTLDVANRFTP
jgi:hypothetical protein